MTNLTPNDKILDELMSSIKNKNSFDALEHKLLSKRTIDFPNISKTILDKFGNSFLLKPIDFNSNSEIEETAALYRLGFPELFGGSYQELLFPLMYSSLKDKYSIWILKDSDDKTISAITLTPDVSNMSVEISAGTTNPIYRRRGLGTVFRTEVDSIINLSGAELGIAYCATFHTTTQNIFKNLGYSVVGKLDGFILSNVGNGMYARDNVLLMTKLYGTATNLCPVNSKLIYD